MPITPPPPAPDPNDPANYPARGDAMMAWFPTMVSEANDLEENVEAQAAAAVAAAASAIAAPGTSATSTSSVAIGLGAKAFTIQTGKSLVPGMFVAVAQTSNPANWMHGSVFSYNSGTGALVVLVTSLNGDATIADWTISISAPTPLTKATAAQIWQGTSDSVAATPAALLAAAAAVDIADGATITLDLKAGIKFRLTTGITADRVIANPTNMVIGQIFSLWIPQGVVGGKNATFGSYWDFGAVTPRLTSTASKADIITGEVIALDHILGSIRKGFRAS